MIVRFAEPAFLWLLLLLPFVWFMARRLRGIPLRRRMTILALRTLLLLLLVLSLARMEFARTTRDLAVFFLLDRSDSIPPARQEEQLALLGEITQTGGPNDHVGVIVFGGEASVETSTVSRYEFEGRLLSSVDGTATDIGGALRLALAAFPADKMKRIVLVSDGNENAGSALDVARHARNSGVPIDTIPVEYEASNDVRIDRITLPQNTNEDAPFDVRVHLTSDEAARGVLRLYRDGDLVAQEEVPISAGRNVPLVIPQRLEEGGFHTYEATIEVPGDLRPQNNRAEGYTWVEGEPRVLLVEGGDPASIGHLAAALRVENIRVDVGGPSSLPTSLDELQRHDAIILSNTAAGMMTRGQMQLIERGVHDLGIGLVMIGGENSFGAGGYTDTPVEAALPVSMDIRERRVLPNGALVIILHTVEIPQGNAWAREISLAALNVLSSEDYFGLVYFGAPAGQAMGAFGSWSERWLWDPGVQRVGEKRNMRSAIRGVQPLDMKNFDAAMRVAWRGLENVPAQTKHIVIISDGDPSPPSMTVMNDVRNAGVTISTVVIAPHNQFNVENMEQIAYRGGGNFYYPQLPSELPRIFTREATVVRQSLIREETFTPSFDMPSELLQEVSALPPLDGYVVTSPKDLATQALVTEWDDPLLAHWRHGLGKAAAFTSDAKTRWAPAWVAWDGFAQFWAQTVRWALRESQSPNYQVATEIAGGRGRVVVDAMDDAGNYRNFLDFDTVVLGPDFEPLTLDMRQVAPGRYEATFPAGRVGTYMVSMTAEDRETEGAEFLTTGVSLSYSPEYGTSRSNTPFLERLSEASGGRLVRDPSVYTPWERTMLPERRPRPVWPLLLLLAALLLPVDVFVRRVYMSWSDVAGWLSRRLPGRKPAEDPAAPARMESLREAKRRALREHHPDKDRREARKAFRERLEKRAATLDTKEGSLLDDPEKASPPAHRRQEKQTVTPREQDAPPPQQGMSSLLEAKKRALDKKRRR